MSSIRIARCALGVALLAVASSIVIPLGPVPFTLQTLALALLPAAVGGRDATITVALYLLVGLLGLPVFAGFSSGIASIVGPTGGFLWGFLLGTGAAALVLGVEGIPSHLRDVIAAGCMLLVSYALGTIQLMFVMGTTLPGALAVAVVPFIVPDILKIVCGVQIGRRVRRALAPQRAHA